MAHSQDPPTSEPAPSPAPSPATAPISTVSFEGLSRTAETFARGVVNLHPGDPADRTTLDQAVTRLLGTGRFLSASYRLFQEEAGVRVVFELREPATITAVRFEGNERFSDRNLAPLVNVKVGDGIDLFSARDGRETLLSKYRQDGFRDVTVTLDEARLRDAGELVYTMVEGKRVRIHKIGFEGNQTFPAGELKRHIETKTAFWILRTGAFDEDQTQTDVARLQGFYRDQGFLDARVTYRSELDDSGRRLTVVFTIEEGTRYRIEEIEFRGHTVFSREELLAAIASRVGEFAKRPVMENDARVLRDRYGEIGYLYVNARIVRLFSDEPGLVRLVAEIEEGDQFRVGRVVVRGNERTKDKVVRRALNLYPPDDLFDLTEAREAEKRLVESRVFRSARVYPVGNDPGVRDAVIDVIEADKLGDFIFGAGVTSNSGFVGNIILELQNFDWRDWPRSWSEFLKFRSFFGGGQRLRLELQPGTDLQRFRIDFTEPYFRDRPVRLDLSGYLFERGRDGYVEGRRGMSVSFGKRFERGVMPGWSGEVALRAENAIVDDVELFASREIRRDEGSNLLTSIKGTLVRDRTDNRFVPTAGDRIRGSYEQFGALGGDHAFGRLTGGYTRYITVTRDVLERKSVLELRAEGGVILGDAPVFERFYAGGTGSLRGFEFRGVGERDGLDRNFIGGDFLALLGAEYSYPLVGDNVRGLLFLDTGTVGSGTWRASIGTGVRFTLDIFGPVPLELGVAAPISRDPDDEEQIFHFMIGGAFGGL